MKPFTSLCQVQQTVPLTQRTKTSEPQLACDNCLGSFWQNSVEIEKPLIPAQNKL